MSIEARAVIKVFDDLLNEVEKEIHVILESDHTWHVGPVTVTVDPTNATPSSGANVASTGTDSGDTSDTGTEQT